MIDSDVMVARQVEAQRLARDVSPSSSRSSRVRSRRGRPCSCSAASSCARENGQLQLAATDMELSLRTSLEADVGGEGEVVVPGRLLLDIARSLPEADVSIEHLADESVRLDRRCGSASYRMHTYSAEDFPRLPEIDAVAAPAGRPRRARSRRSRVSAARRRATRAGPC